MNRIIVIGISPGVGKSTLAKRLGEILNIDVYHLDNLFWKPGWIESSLDEFSAEQEEIVKKQAWIIEGNYSNTFEIRAVNCDTVIYMELPLYVCLYRVVKRWLTYIGKTRPDMTNGCKEKIDWKFIKFIVTTYNPRKIKMNARLKKIKESGKKIIILKNKQDIDTYLKREDFNR